MQTLKGQTRTVWLLRLSAALRTVVACSIVAATTLYSPSPIRHLITYPTYSYMTTILIMSDATAGKTFQSFWNVVYASAQVVLSSVLSLWLVGPARFTPSLAAAAVAVTSFAVAIQEHSHQMSKKIALGQIVIVYVGTIEHGAGTDVVMHPVHVALSTGLAAIASVLALLLPWPRLVRKACQMYIKTAVERLNFYLDAFSSGDVATASDSIRWASSSSRSGARLLKNIKDKEDGMLWERPDIRFLRPNHKHLEERFQEMELPLRGMELAVNSCSSFPIPTVDEELRNILHRQKLALVRKLKQAKCFAPFNETAAPENGRDSTKNSLYALRTIPWSHEHLMALFFLLCLEILQGDLPKPATDNKPKFSIKHRIRNLKPSSKSLVFAFKCSISLGLAVLFGLMYNRKNAYWAGLIIATGLEMERQPIFTASNSRAQGTAIGSVYGSLCFFIFKRFTYLRLFLLVPWIIFTRFLQHSRMYRREGGISAAIGALLILGRKNYGSPRDFAIIRITEATIGLICFIAVEILFEPARAGTLARTELSRSFREAKECIKCIVPCHTDNGLAESDFAEFWEKLNQLKACFARYKTYTEEAKVEPNFWFCPLPMSHYCALLESFSRIIDLLQFLARQLDGLKELCPKAGLPWKNVLDPLKNDLELFKEREVSTFECLEKVTSIKTILEVDKQLRKKARLRNIGMGNTPRPTPSPSPCIGKEEAQKISESFLCQLNGVTNQVRAHECDEEVKSQIALCLGGFGFCIDKLMKETTEMEDTVKELIMRQNPASHVNLSEISRKVDALRS